MRASELIARLVQLIVAYGDCKISDEKGNELIGIVEDRTEGEHYKFVMIVEDK